MRSFPRLVPGSLLISCLLLFTITAIPQSQALDGQIEGIVVDKDGAVIDGAEVRIVNSLNGTRRSSITSDEGAFRFVILPLGTYSITVSHTGFKNFEQKGILLSAGQTVSLVLSLDAGDPSETVLVTSDSAIADGSRFDVGRQINSREVNNLPLVSRNPLNYALLQPGVTGRTVNGPQAVPLSSNGLLRRSAYGLDGGYNNDSDVAGFRLTLVSEVFVQEIQLLSSGYSAEFGNTAGLVVNVVTPAGSNRAGGSVTVLWRPASLSAKPVGFRPGSQEPNIDGFGSTAAVSGPIIKDRWHFFAGYERTVRKTIPVFSISDANRNSLVATGLSPTIFSNTEGVTDWFPYLILRTDVNLNGKTRMAFRYNRFDADLRNGGTGGINTAERSSDRYGWDQAFGFQAVSELSESLFNEFRFQRVERITGLRANEYTGTGVSVAIPNVANLGPPPGLGAIDTNQSLMHFQDAVTRSFNRHLIKAGGGILIIRDTTLLPVSATYTFSSVQAYRDAVNGSNRRSYSSYQESFGEPSSPFNAYFLNGFFQDEWKLTRRLKVSAGMRYDLYLPPGASRDSPLEFSRKFKTDTNNLGPRLGLVYLLRDGRYRTVVRAGGGVHFDPPMLRLYRRATQNNGDPRFFSATFQAGSLLGPEFPNRLGTLPQGSVLARDVDAVSPDFKTMYALHSNVQLEQALAEDLSVTVGYLRSIARHIPVYRNINCRPTGGTLADGRPVYGSLSVNANGNVNVNPCTDRQFPEFRTILMAEASGNLNYQGLFIQLNKRYSSGFQLGASYTFSTARDDAPESNGPDPLVLSDPSNRTTDLGRSWGDVKQTFRFSMIARPSARTRSRILSAILNGNQLGVIIFADSGEVQNIVTNFDLNRDGVFGNTGPDRPVGVPRNSLRIPAFFNVDLRISRSFTLGADRSIEIYAEAANAFNGKFLSSYGSTSLAGSNLTSSLVNPVTGQLRGPLPDFNLGVLNWRPMRQIQLGVKVYF